MNRACQTCHNWPEEELKARVETSQERTVELRDTALDALVDLVGDLASAREAGRNDEGVVEARRLHKRATMMIDFIESENSAGFHASQEAARVLAQAIDTARKAQRALYANGKKEVATD